MRTSYILIIAAACGLLCSCFSESENPPLLKQEAAISNKSAGVNFSLHLSADRLYIIYPSLDALSLNLVTAGLAEDPGIFHVNGTTYLDRISYSPDIDAGFGRHLFLAGNGLHQILYADRESEDSSVLKWLSKTDAEDTWWIDAFPELREPLVAVTEEDGALQVVVAEGGSLSRYRLSRKGIPSRLSSTVVSSGRFQARGDVSPVRQGDYWAFTAYDAESKRLYFVQPAKDALDVQPIYSAGEVNYCTIIGGRLLIVVFEPSKSTITLLESELPRPGEAEQPPFEVLPVTLCKGTTSVFLASLNGHRLFLFNERVTDQQNRTSHQLSLLFPLTRSSGYGKIALVQGEAPIGGFEALQNGDYLYVLYLRRDRLTLLSLSLAQLPAGDSIED